MKTDYPLTLDLYNENNVAVPSKQYDDAGRRILVTLTEFNEPFSIPETATFTVKWTKPDKKFVVNNCSVENGKVVIVETLQMLSNPGKAYAELTMLDNNTVISTMPFPVGITKSIVQRDDIESTTELNALTEALLEVKKWDAVFTKTNNQIEQKYTDRLNGIEVHEVSGQVADSIYAPLEIAEIQGKSNQNAYIGKNLLQNIATTQTVNGITFTVNADKSVTVSGTASVTTNLTINVFTFKKDKSYILSGCPDTGSYGTYRQFIQSSILGYPADQGINGVIITPSETEENVKVNIQIFSGYTINKTFKPMIRPASITDATYEPYCGNMPAPNPSYPQEITSLGDGGEWHLKVTDGTNTQSIAFTDVLRGLESYKDKIYLDTDNVWKKAINTVKFSLDGTENWVKGSPTTVDRFYLVLSNDVKAMTITDTEGISSHFRCKKNFNPEVGTFYCNSMADATILFVDFSEPGKTTLAQFKAFLASHNVTFILPSANPTVTTLSDSLQTALGNLTSYDNSTTVNPDDVTNPTVKFRYAIGVTGKKILESNKAARSNSGSLKKITNKRHVILGDSYGVGCLPNDATCESWIPKLANYLGLTSNDYYSYAVAGYGFSKAYHKWLDLLQANDSEITDKESITDFIICGGYNDRKYTVAAIQADIDAFMTYVKANYPNATVYVGCIGWSLVFSDAQEICDTSMVAYSTAQHDNLIYLSGVENILHSYDDFSSDGIHPLESGQTKLAKGIYNAYKNGYCSVYYPEKTLNITLDTAYFTANAQFIKTSYRDGIATVEIVGSTLNCNTGVTFKGDTSYKIASYTNGTKYCVNNIDCLVPMLYKTTSNVKMIIPTYISIGTDGIWIRPFAINSAGSDWLQSTFSTIGFHSLTFTYSIES